MKSIIYLIVIFGFSYYMIFASGNQVETPNQITFREGLELDDNGHWQGITETNIIITREDISLATLVMDTDITGEYCAVSIELTSAGAVKFAEATKRIAAEHGVISIWIDDILLAAPVVQTAITDGKLQISGGFDEESSVKLVNAINAGAIPFELEVAECSVGDVG